MKNKTYDVIILGGGISGCALLYVLTKYTDIKNIALIEKYESVAKVNSNSKSNSQTLHFGDIETNYTLEKAKKVKSAADLVKNYLERYDKEKKTFSKYQKMVLGVGEEEVKELEKRHKEFKELFPDFRRIEKKEIEKIEPRVIEGRSEKEKILALASHDGYTIDFKKLSESFINEANKNKDEKNIDIYFNTKVKKINKTKSGHEITTDKGVFESPCVNAAMGAHSLLFAKQLGYGKEFALLSVAGSFYTAPKILNGKVYTVQLKKLPFAAIHGDPEVHNPDITRFGPTAKVLLMLERHKYKTVFEYFKTAGLSVRAFLAFYNILSDWTILKYIAKNFIYDLPIAGKRLFIKEVKEIVPLIKLDELKSAKGYGGNRPQIVNLKTKTLDLGEAKIRGENISFNITPSPGASTCLRNALDDTKNILESFKGKFKFDENKFNKDLKN